MRIEIKLKVIFLLIINGWINGSNDGNSEHNKASNILNIVTKINAIQILIASYCQGEWNLNNIIVKSSSLNTVSNIISIAISDKRKCLIFAADKTIKIVDFDISTQKVGQNFKDFGEHEYNIFSIALSHCQNYVASFDNKIIKLWDLEKGNVKIFIDPEEINSGLSINSIAFSPCNKYLASGSLFSVNVWDINSQSSLKKLDHTDFVLKIIYQPNGNLCSITHDGIIKIWDIKSFECIKEINTLLHAAQKSICGVIGSPCFKYVAIGMNNSINIWEISSGNCIKILKEATKNQNENIIICDAIIYSPCGKYIVSGYGNDKIKIWDVNFESKRYGNCIKIWEDNEEWIITSSIKFSPCGKYLIYGCMSGNIKILKSQVAELLD